MERTHCSSFLGGWIMHDIGNGQSLDILCDKPIYRTEMGRKSGSSVSIEVVHTSTMMSKTSLMIARQHV
jgi:hypothetical protein